MDIRSVIEELKVKTKDLAMMYAYAYDSINHKPRISFRSTYMKDPISGAIYLRDPFVDNIAWSISAVAYDTKKKKYIETVEEFNSTDLEDIILHIKAQGAIGADVIHINLKSKRCIRREIINEKYIVYTEDKE